MNKSPLPSSFSLPIMFIHTDRELVECLHHDSQKAFEEVFRKYSKELYVYSLQFTKSAEEAEEIVHDVFIRLWDNRDKLQSVDSLRPLLFRMSKHLLINAFRARINSPVFEEYVEVNDCRRSEGNSLLEYEELVSQIQHNIQLLPRQQRLIVEKAKFEELSPLEIAKELGISVQTVRNQLTSGLKRLRELLSDTIPLIMLLFIK